jgi:hypothetical protein
MIIKDVCQTVACAEAVIAVNVRPMKSSAL